jgi:hypothetical protein
LFEELRTFSNRTKKKNVLEFIWFLWNFPFFSKKNRTFPEVPADYSIEQQKMNHACHTFCDISKMAVSFSLV